MTGEVSAAAKSLHSCPTLCDPIDGSPPGSSVFGIFQARVLEWGAIAFSDSKQSPWIFIGQFVARREEESSFFLLGSTIVIWCEDSRFWSLNSI